MAQLRVNPFRPDEVISPMHFVGRQQEIGLITSALNQTIAGLPEDVLILGERWIGKSSLATYASALARNGKEAGAIKGMFNPIFCRLGACRSLDEICTTIIDKLQRRVPPSFRNKTLDVIKKVGGISIGPVGIQFNPGGNPGSVVAAFPALMEHMIPATLGEEFTGVLIILDETEQVAAIEGIGSFFKNLNETLRDHEFKHRTKLSFLVTATPDGYEQLRRSHASFPRLFRIASLDIMRPQEVEQLVKALLKLGSPVCTITNDAMKTLQHYCDGFPGVIQELGYQAFEANKDDAIDNDDVINGIVGIGCVGTLDSLYIKHFQPIIPTNVKSPKSFEIMKAFVDSAGEVVLHKELAQKLKGVVPTNSISAYVKGFIDKGTIVKVGEGQYKFASRMLRLYMRLKTKFAKR